MHIMTDISQMFLYLHYLFISQQQSTEFHATNTSSETKCWSEWMLPRDWYILRNIRVQSKLVQSKSLY